MEIPAVCLLEAPRGGPFSLQERCLWALAHSQIRKIDEIIFKHSWKEDAIIVNQISFSRVKSVASLKVVIFSRDRALFVPWTSNLLLELVRRLLKRIYSTATFTYSAVSFAMTLALSTVQDDSFKELKLKFILKGFEPTEVLQKYASSFGTGLKVICATKTKIDDNFILALSTSKAAPSLQKLIISECQITDASIEAWSRFSALQHIDVSMCYGISVATLHTISLIPTLTALCARSEPPLATIEDFDRLVDSRRLSSLNRLQIAANPLFSDPETKDRAFEIVSRLPSLSKLSVGIPCHGDSSSFLHSHLTALEDTFFVATPWNADSLKSILPYCSNVAILHIPEDICCISSQSDLIGISQYFSRLKSLQFASSPTFAVEDLSMFSNLREVGLMQPDLHKIVCWPPLLRKISVTELKNSAPDPALSTAKFFESLRPLTYLQELYCVFAAISQDAVSVLLGSMTQLEQIDISARFIYPPGTSLLPLNRMPFLQRVAFNSMKSYLDPNSIYLPSLMYSPNLGSIPFENCSVEQLPNMDSISIKGSPSLAERNSYLELMSRFSPRIRRVLDVFSAFVPAGICYRMHQLEHLQLSRQITQAELAELLANLPRLSNVDLIVSSQVHKDDFSWLKHDRISSLSLDFPRDNPSTEAPALTITSSNFPSLHILHLELRSLNVQGLSIYGHNNLQSVLVTGSEHPLAFQMFDCAFVREAWLNYLTLDSVRIFNVPNFMFLHIDCYRLPSDDADIFIQAPQLAGQQPDTTTNSSHQRLFALNRQNCKKFQ